MPDLILGNVTFYIDELPEQMNLGGEQVLAIRKFPGGGLDIQALGSFDDQISWSGVFMFQNAVNRVQKVGIMRVQAKPVQMQISFIKRTVMVAQFKFNYVNDFYIPYTITLQPCDDGTVNGTAVTAQSSSSTSSNTTTTAVQSTTHTIVSSDTLWKLAVVYYSDGTKWPTIASANNISDPGNLAIGTVLTIPKLS